VSEAPAPEPKRGSDLGPRLVTAAIGVPILLALAFFAPNWALWLLVAGAAAIGAWEYLAMTLRGDVGFDGRVATAIVFATLSAAYWGPDPASAFYAASGGVIALLALALGRADRVNSVAERVGHLLAAYAYTAVLFGALLMLVAGPDRGAVWQYQAGWLLFAMGVVFGGDTGAYFAGRAFGRHRLAPIVSPKKTIEGAVGGLLASIGVGYLMWALVPLPAAMTAWHVLVLAAPAAVLGQVGDLCESLIKRSVGVKDSGRILYGHGGMLDRVDALVFAAPWLFAMRGLLGLDVG
jgi:phosphatidate cytidylyltransferase